MKSPVWRIVPRGVWTAIATASATLWLTLINSILNCPKFIVSLGLTTLSLNPVELVSLSLASTSPRVSLVPKTGTFNSRNIKGKAPIWSS